jgi:hypothetical protein
VLSAGEGFLIPHPFLASPFPSLILHPFPVPLPPSNLPSFNGFVQQRCWPEKNSPPRFYRRNSCDYNVLFYGDALRLLRDKLSNNVTGRHSDSQFAAPFPVKVYALLAGQLTN